MSIQFGKNPTAIQDAGRMRGLSGREYLVWNFLTGHCDGVDFVCRRLRVEDIAEMSGASMKTVERGIEGLKSRGLVVVIHKRGRGLVNEYRLQTDPRNVQFDQTPQVVSSKADDQTPQVVSSKADDQTPQVPVTRQFGSDDPTVQAVKCDTASRASRTPDIPEPTRAEIAVGFHGREDVKEELTKCGVVGATVETLLVIAWVTVERIRTLWPSCNRPGVKNPSGLLVTKLSAPPAAPKSSAAMPGQPHPGEGTDEYRQRYLIDRFTKLAARGTVGRSPESLVWFLAVGYSECERGYTHANDRLPELLADEAKVLEYTTRDGREFAQRTLRRLETDGQLPGVLSDASGETISAAPELRSVPSTVTDAEVET